MKKNFAIILIARRVRFVLGYSEFFLHTKFQQQSQQYQVIVWLQYTTTLSTSSRSLTYMYIFCLKLFSECFEVDRKQVQCQKRKQVVNYFNNENTVNLFQHLV